MLAMTTLMELAPSITDPIMWIGGIILIGMAWGINVKDATKAEVNQILSGDSSGQNGPDSGSSGTS